MAVTFELPPEVEQTLRRELRDLDSEAREALLVDLYRRGMLSGRVLSESLELDRIQTEELLQKHGVTEDLGTLNDYLSDAKALAALRERT